MPTPYIKLSPLPEPKKPCASLKPLTSVVSPRNARTDTLHSCRSKGIKNEKLCQFSQEKRDNRALSQLFSHIPTVMPDFTQTHQNRLHSECKTKIIRHRYPRNDEVGRELPHNMEFQFLLAISSCNVSDKACPQPRGAPQLKRTCKHCRPTPTLSTPRSTS